MAKVTEKNKTFNFQLEYWYRHVQCGEIEKDSDRDNVIAEDLQSAKEILLEKHDSPSYRIFEINLISQTPTLTKSDLFNLTSPTLCF